MTRSHFTLVVSYLCEYLSHVLALVDMICSNLLWSSHMIKPPDSVSITSCKALISLCEVELVEENALLQCVLLVTARLHAERVALSSHQRVIENTAWQGHNTSVRMNQFVFLLFKIPTNAWEKNTHITQLNCLWQLHTHINMFRGQKQQHQANRKAITFSCMHCIRATFKQLLIETIFPGELQAADPLSCIDTCCVLAFLPLPINSCLCLNGKM